MKISLNWLKKYVDIKIPNDELITLIGSRLVEVEGVIDETHKYDNIYIVRVEKAEKIEGTHLTLCQISTSTGDAAEKIQVVCGAPNVREGMLAVWLKPGATVPASVHEDAPFVIGKRKMLGKYDSNGMLAGADELDFGDDHSGIVEIDPSLAQPGDALADIFELNDLILEIENKSLTHRPDCFGLIGFAREVAGILGQKFTDPDFLHVETVFPKGFLEYNNQNGVSSKKSKLKVIIKDKELCPRYSAVVLEQHGELKQKYLTYTDTLLAKSGMRPIDHIVDVTNYLMLLTGQPLHAFDYDKFIEVGKTDSATVIVRSAVDGEKIELLDGEVIKCNPNDILITSNDIPVALAGAMGGKSTEIDDSTTRILIESASFSLYNLRKTQMAHGIFSEAITRFTKGVPAGGTFSVLAEAVKEIGGTPTEVTDVFPGWQAPSVVKITTHEINSLLGTTYDTDLIVRTLENVGFKATSTGDGPKNSADTANGHFEDVRDNGSGIASEPRNDGSERSGPKNVHSSVLTITAPTWRTDIHIKEDIIEEIGRLLGYDNITPTLPLHATASKNPSLALKSDLRDLLSKLGANEVLTYSFVSKKLLDRATQDPKNSYKIINSISPDLEYVRQSLLPSLLDKTYLNQKLPVDQFAIFEMNQVYQKVWGLDAEKVPVIKNRLALVVAERKNHHTAFYQVKTYIDKVLKTFGITPEYIPLKSTSAEAKPFEPKRSAEIKLGDVTLGFVGEFKNSVRANFKLADFLAGFELDLDLLLEHQNHKKTIDKFIVKDKQDITITTTKTYAEILKELQQKYPNAEITPLGVYQPGDSTEKNITYHLKFY